jgi:hypothetical protein
VARIDDRLGSDSTRAKAPLASISCRMAALTATVTSPAYTSPMLRSARRSHTAWTAPTSGPPPASRDTAACG